MGKGKGLDLWTVPHLLFGVLMGMTPALFGVPTLTALVSMLVLSVLWEAYEVFAKIRETMLNRFVDISVHVVGFAFIFLLLKSFAIEKPVVTTAAFVVFVLYAGMNILGWFAHLKRKQRAAQKAVAEGEERG